MRGHMGALSCVEWLGVRVVGRGGISWSQVPDHTQGCRTREGGYPVRRGLSAQSLASLEYWITRPSAQLRTRRVVTTGNDTVSRSRAARFARGLLSNFLPLPTGGAGDAGRTLHPPARLEYGHE